MAKKVAYVTGGMGGIGTAICQRLHKEGFTVIAGCGPTRDWQKWLDEQKALGELLNGTELYTRSPEKIAETHARFAAIDEALLALLERWEELGSR